MKQWRIHCAMKWSNLLVATTCLGLAGCSVDYPLEAFFKDGKLYFDGAKKDWFFGSTGFCPEYLSVQSQSGETVWRIEKVPRTGTDPDRSECNLFPVSYGLAPNGWGDVVPPKPLKSGELYVLKGQGGDAYHGAFRYRERRLLTVENEPELAHKLPDPPYQWKDGLE